jgi:PAS domain S-box-containing protein
MCFSKVFLAVGVLSVSVFGAQAQGNTAAPVFLGNQNLPPIVYLQDGVPHGVAVDLFGAMLPHLPAGSQLQAMNWKQAQALVTAGDAQALVQINRTPERDKLYDFSDPLLESEFVIFVRTSSRTISTADDLKGKRVGVEEAGLPQQILSKDSGATLVFSSDFPTAFSDLADGKLDAVVADERVGEYVLATRKIGGIKSTGLPLALSSSAIAVQKGNSRLLGQINAALARIRADGTYQKVLANWNPTEVLYETRSQVERNQILLLATALAVGLLVALLWSLTLHRSLRRKDRLQTLLASSEKQLSGILQNSQDAIGVHSNGIWEIANPAAVRLFGVDSAADLLGTSILTFLAPDEGPRIQEYVRRCQNGEAAPDHYLTRGVRRDGVVFEMEVTQSEYELEGRKLALVILRDVSDRVRRDQAIQESEALYRTLVTTSPDPVVLYQEARILYNNPAALRIFGAQTTEDLVGLSILDRFHADCRQVAEVRLGSLEPGLDSEKFLGQLLRLDGSSVDAVFRGSGLTVAGKPTVLLLVHELTERNEAKARQNTLLKRYEAILASAGDGIHILDSLGNVIDVNPAFCAMLGYTREELLQLNVSAWDAQWSTQQLTVKVAELVENPQVFETRHRRKDSTLLDVEVSGVGVELEGVHYLYASARDVTQRKRAETLIRSQAAQLRALYDTIPDLVWLKDTNLRFLSGNHRLELLLGLPEPQIIGRSVKELFGGEIAEPVERRDRLALRAEEPLINEEELTFADGHTEVTETTRAAVRDKNGQLIGVLGIGRNITNRKASESENARLQGDLARSQKLEGLGILASGLAHEMNNVLASILTVATAKQLVLAQTDPSAHSFEMISKAAERGGKTVRNLLGFARRTILERKTIDCNELIQTYALLLQNTLPPHLRLELKLTDGLAPIEGDPSALTQALADLCSNAVDAMPEPGTLTLRTETDAQATLVCVEDTGTGMSKEVQQRALDPFFTTKPEGKGTGLGLALVYRTLESHGATLAIDSKEGQGTIITMRFPTTTSPPQVAAEVPPISEVKGLKVLIVDDDEMLLEAVKELVETLGNRPHTATGGGEALELLKNGLNPDVMILDFNMPDLDGAQTLAQLRPQFPQLPVILSTGRTDQAALDLVEAFPKVSLLAKPYSLQELTQALEAALPGGGVVTARL